MISQFGSLRETNPFVTSVNHGSIISENIIKPMTFTVLDIYLLIKCFLMVILFMMTYYERMTVTLSKVKGLGTYFPKSSLIRI